MCSPQQGDLQNHEELLPTRSQHGLLLLRQQDHHLHHVHPVRPPGKHHVSQPGVRDGVAVQCCATHRHTVLSKRHREAV